MSIYITEAEQIALFKAWWRRHYRSVLLIVSAVILTLSVVTYWQWHQQIQKEQASNIYERIMIAFSNHDTKAVRAYSHQLIASYPKTVYADTAQLLTAKLAIESGQYAKAIHALSQVTHSKFKVLGDIARLRLARIFAYQHAFDKAWVELNQVTNPSYRSVKSELSGDLHYAQKDFQQALRDYQAAASAMDHAGVSNLFLEMKQQALRAMIHQPTAVVQTS